MAEQPAADKLAAAQTIDQQRPMSERAQRLGSQRLAEVGLVFLRLGSTSFGGPAAHMVYFRDAFVLRRRWLEDAAYAELLALVQLLPGPSSTQLAMTIGIGRAGLAGGLVAWLGFTLPSALIMVVFGLVVGQIDGFAGTPWLHGLKVVVVGVVAQAVLSMSRQLCPDRLRWSIALLAALCALAIPGTIGQLLVIGGGGLVGWFGLPNVVDRGPRNPAFTRVTRSTATVCLSLFVLLLIGLPALQALHPTPTGAVIDSFYRAGALVFGGGHVILPLLQAELVEPGWVDPELFLAGYGAAQALPGPLFTFAAYLGVVMTSPLSPLWTALLCLVVLFLPSALLVLGVLPFWGYLREFRGMAGGLAGVGAAVVGLLVAVLIHPIWSSAIHGIGDLVLAAIAFGLLSWGRLPPWLIVLGCATASYGFAQLPL